MQPNVTVPLEAYLHTCTYIQAYTYFRFSCPLARAARQLAPVRRMVVG